MEFIGADGRRITFSSNTYHLPVVAIAGGSEMYDIFGLALTLDEAREIREKLPSFTKVMYPLKRWAIVYIAEVQPPAEVPPDA